MSYKACNEVLGKIFKDCVNSPENTNIPTPWGVVLNGTGRFAAVAATAHNLVGVAKNEKGKYKIYYGSKNAGNWFFEIWSLWKSSLVFFVYSYLYWEFAFSGLHALQTYGLLTLGAIGLLLFGGRTAFCQRHLPVGLIAGGGSFRDGMVPCFVGTATAIGCFISAYSFMNGLQLGDADAFLKKWGSGNWGEIQQAVFFGIPTIVIFSMITQAAFTVNSLRVMVDVVAKTEHYTPELYGAGERSGLISQYSRLRSVSGPAFLWSLLFLLMTISMIGWSLLINFDMKL
ncbi:hypothetical protein ACT5AY_001468 [Pseudomonas aeruginosa]|uniref:hypothetical protein n=1 Tax=Pseudomonas aeruginosa group TaxID=136841 RepID=UPI000A8A2720|nr:hypothetical protein [Pseudomonas paraeruginosa]MBG5165518.1 hypothetical protein [Pseudomonas aeruginosa]MBH3771477.1 hypothetical protein [Pseudomonas aeruginosa]RTT26701.1 hypothetical protein DY956_30275 [Pseudomonas paraeruginosa]HEK1481304.1 hypothetical protein [Pseudomonas aeruginosa]